MTQTTNTDGYEKVDEVGENEIDGNLEESFLASDPLSWTLGINHLAVETSNVLAPPN